MVADALDALQDKFSGCDTIAFADLSTQMILVTNTGTAHPREKLDNLCAEAALTLGTSRKLAIGTAPGETAIVSGPEQLRIFLRAKKEPSDVLCCIFHPSLDVAAFLPEARACLEQISSGA
ncbi:hypothetical protein [Yoonia sp. BS5-3]|uniref:Roadblock/LAMTOR2 domain-containing protein n=1 Tax=Yoonia phaeophyticola TaxID=3137369 RepID=A0ABZ2V4F4_9RHOB